MRAFLDLSIERRTDGDWNLKQDAGPCDDTSEHWIIMAPEQLNTLARMAGYVPADEIKRACERVLDRLNLLAVMVKAHTREGDPLRDAVAALLNTPATKTVATNLVAGAINQNGCDPSGGSPTSGLAPNQDTSRNRTSTPLEQLTLA